MGKQMKHCSQGFLVLSLILLGCFTIPVIRSQGNGIRNGESYGIDINNVTACIRKPFSSQFCCQNKNSRISAGNGIRNGESYGIDINNVTACIRKPFSSQFCCQNKNSPNLGRCYGSVSDCQSNCPNVLDPHLVFIIIL
uniref:SREBP regulating gene protein n=1 Tax=Oryza nivara TaxID=4536 RepID=A0A0E0G596_ORYNI